MLARNVSSTSHTHRKGAQALQIWLRVDVIQVKIIARHCCRRGHSTVHVRLSHVHSHCMIAESSLTC